jgi:hypothetical protein
LEAKMKINLIAPGLILGLTLISFPVLAQESGGSGGGESGGGEGRDSDETRRCPKGKILDKATKTCVAVSS